MKGTWAALSFPQPLKQSRHFFRGQYLAHLCPPDLSLLRTIIASRPISLGAAPARPFDSRPGALTMSTSPGSLANPTFVHLISNDCASFATSYVRPQKHAGRRQASVHFFKQDPRVDSINLFKLQKIICLMVSWAGATPVTRNRRNGWEAGTKLRSGRQNPSDF
jgi:hypothetical protein